MNFKNLPVFKFLILLATCGQCLAMSSIPADTLAAIPSISIAHEVKMPERLFYNGPEVAIPAALAGVVGGVLASNADGVPEKMKIYLEKEKIDVAEIVREEFYSGLKADPRFAAKLQEDGKGKFILEVYNFGLGQNHGFSSDYRALIGIRAKFALEDGTVVWQGKAYNKESAGHPFDYYFESPDAFRNEYRAGAKMVTKLILDQM